MLSFRSRQMKPGWIAVDPDSDVVRSVSLVCEAACRPVLQWAVTTASDSATQALRSLRREQPMSRQRRVALLQHSQYQLLTLDVPDLPREEWRDAIRWRLKSVVDFPVEGAGIDLLEIPGGAQQRPATSLFVVAAPRSILQPLADAGTAAGLPWHAIDVPETALRNLASLFNPDGGVAMLHVGPAHSTLVVAAAGELLATRHIEVTLAQLTESEYSQREQHFERAGLAVQRVLDNVERQFGHVNISALQLAPGPPLVEFASYLRALVYDSVTEFDLGAVVDLSAVPELVDVSRHGAYLLPIGAALR